MTDGLAVTLPHGALSGQDALCTRPIGLAQTAAQVTCHMQEELIEALIRGMHPGIEQRPRQGAAWLDGNRALSRASYVSRLRQRAIFD